MMAEDFFLTIQNSKLDNENDNVNVNNLSTCQLVYSLTRQLIKNQLVYLLTYNYTTQFQLWAKIAKYSRMFNK